MNSNPVVLIHLNENVGRMIGHGHWVVFVEINTYDVAVPTDASSEIVMVESLLGCSRISRERFVAAIFKVRRPGYTRDGDY